MLDADRDTPGRDRQARECIARWSERDLPLVVTRQRSVDRLALGLAAPIAFGSHRIAVEVAARQVASIADFPLATGLDPSMPPHVRASWRCLVASLERLHCAARAFGSHGWQHLTGLHYVHADSDIDLLLPVSGAAHADALCAALVDIDHPLPRIDAELLFGDGAAIAASEWRQWRSGRVDRVLVKRLGGASLEVFDPRREMASC